MSEFKVFRVYQDDGKIQGKLEQSTLNDLSPGEVVIKVAYSSVNYKDALVAKGSGKFTREFPVIGGIDSAGYVVSSENKDFKEGDAVLVTGYELGTNHDGGYSEYARVPTEWVVPLPEGMSPKQAMSIGTAGFTVALCVQRLEENLQTPEHGPFVVTGASGGVGNYAIDILSGLGYEVVAVSGKDSEKEKLLALGASKVIDRNEIDLSGPALEKAQWGGAIDNVGGDILAWLTRTTKPWGNIVSVGLAGGSHLNTTVMPFILRGVSLLGVTSSGCPTELRHRLWNRLATDLAPKHLDKIVTRVAGMDDLPDIFDSLLAGTSTGRTIIKIAEQD
ncbi:MAG: oxidoreductase [Gammaproteobacteria bacterium]|nr:MAG: oxidoreductase [Gammaproteobacteria bacterium]